MARPREANRTPHGGPTTINAVASQAPIRIAQAQTINCSKCNWAASFIDSNAARSSCESYLARSWQILDQMSYERQVSA